MLKRRPLASLPAGKAKMILEAGLRELAVQLAPRSALTVHESEMGVRELWERGELLVIVGADHSLHLRKCRPDEAPQLREIAPSKVSPIG